jgi:tRNA (cmo5U34)-methyltransferase
MKIKDNIAAEFDDFSRNYTKDMIGLVPFYLKLLESFGTLIPENFQPKKILDLGCGNGNVTNQLVKLYPDSEYTLLDASEQMIDLCEKRFPNNKIEFVNSYFAEYDFPESNFDWVVAGFSIHHCKRDEKSELIKNIGKTLRAGGLFSCSDLMIETSSSDHDLLLQKWKAFVLETYPDGIKWNWLMEHYNEFDFPHSTSQHEVWLIEAGFGKVNWNVFENHWSYFAARKG